MTCIGSLLLIPGLRAVWQLSPRRRAATCATPSPAGAVVRGGATTAPTAGAATAPAFAGTGGGTSFGAGPAAGGATSFGAFGDLLGLRCSRCRASCCRGERSLRRRWLRRRWSCLQLPRWLRSGRFLLIVMIPTNSPSSSLRIHQSLPGRGNPGSSTCAPFRARPFIFLDSITCRWKVRPSSCRKEVRKRVRAALFSSRADSRSTTQHTDKQPPVASFFCRLPHPT